MAIQRCRFFFVFLFTNVERDRMFNELTPNRKKKGKFALKSISEIKTQNLAFR